MNKESNQPTESLEGAAGDISLRVKSDKIEFMWFNQRGDISTQNGTSLKQVDKFTYLRGKVLSTENDVNTPQATAWTAIDRLSVIWKSELSDKIKRSFFFPSSSRIRYYFMDATHGRWLSVWRKRLMSITQEYYELYWTNHGGNKKAAVRQPITHLINHRNKICRILL